MSRHRKRKPFGDDDEVENEPQPLRPGERRINTRSIDVAAYLSINGVEPDEVTLDPRYKVNRFTYRKSERLLLLLKAFRDDAMVPVKTFAGARADMKALNPHGGRVGHRFHLNLAIQNVMDQTKNKRSGS